jgi:asparagine synthase (glutamine-hydrolysing)
MCGIALRFFKEPTVERTYHIKRMLNAMEHRGQDQVEIIVGSNYQVGFRRLAITDLSNGQQPKTVGSWMVFLNGEIYNLRELENELNHPTKSDTEIIAAGLEQQGTEFIKKLNGMFLIVAINGNDVWVFRDRFGIKPFYYFETKDEICLASEIKPITFHPDYSIAENENAAKQFLCFNNIFTDETFFKGIHKVEKGTAWHLNSGNKTKYWDWNFSQSETKYEPDKIRHLVEQAVKRQTTTEVPLAAWLSGGIDSNIIVALSGDIFTFTAGFTEGNDERALAELGCKNHYEIVFNRVRKFAETIYHLEDLRMGASWSNYNLYELTSKFAKVCLQGTGADELFAGYSWRYQAEDYWNIVNRTGIEDDYCRDLFNTIFPVDTIENRWKFDAVHFCEGVLLVGDKLSMAHTIEDRVPFLDNELVDYAITLPHEFKRNKKILKEAFSHLLPLAILEKKKTGFSSPDWFPGDGNQAMKWATTAHQQWQQLFTNKNQNHDSQN